MRWLRRLRRLGILSRRLGDDGDDDDDEEEADVAFAVRLEQGKEVAAEASRASSSI